MFRLMALILFGISAVFWVAKFAVPAIDPEWAKLSTHTQFTTCVAMPGAAARTGWHFETMTALSGEQTRYAYVRIDCKVWLFESVTSSQP